MHPKVLSKEAWNTVRGLAKKGLLRDWILAGGTGLAIQLGHRYSEDLDLFRCEPFDPENLLGEISAHFPLEVQDRSRSTLHARILGLRISFLRKQGRFLFGCTPYRGLCIADPRDIAVMKLAAVSGRGSRKDFIDLYFYFQGGGTLDSVLSLMDRSYPGIDYNAYHLLKSLVYFADAEREPMPRMIRHVSWDEVKARLIAEVKRLAP